MTAAVSSSSSVSTAGLAAALMAPPAASRGPEFAQVLSAQQARQHAPEPAPTPSPADKPAAADKPKASEQNTQTAQNRTAEEARARQTRTARATFRPQGAEAAAPREPAREADATGADKIDKTAATGDVPQGVDPAIAEWLSRLNLPEAPVQAEAKAAPAGVQDVPFHAAAKATVDTLSQGSEAETDPAVERPAVRRGGAGASSETALRQREGVDDKASQSDASQALSLAGGSPAAWHAALEQAAVPVPGAAARAADGLKVDAASAVAAAQGMAAAQPLTDRAAEIPAPVVVHVPTPAEAPEFPKVLGTQLSVLAQDGIQHAELHLNPTDMGPISVQIVLDGDQAKVDFGADSAATRQIIENGLPELAAAMREAGFTLSGGGVHSQAQNQRGGEGRGQRGQPGADGHPVADEPQDASRPSTRVRTGGIDLYA